MPTMRVRQQEIIVLKTFDFGENIYPLIEIVKEHDRARNIETQRAFEDIYNDLIENIKSKHVFVDLPLYLKLSGAVKDEVVSFSMSISNQLIKRCEYLNKLDVDREKTIPVISSYLINTGELESIKRQFELLSINFSKIAFRLFPITFKDDFIEVSRLARPDDYVIMDLDTIIPFPKSPPLRSIVHALQNYTVCNKVLLRSAINTEIQNVKLEHGQVVFDADNSHIYSDIMQDFGVNSTGDFVGIKKDDLTAGGTISPGFIYYNAIENQYYGYRADFKDLSQFEVKIVPDVLASQATLDMQSHVPPFVGPDNPGFVTLQNISYGNESGKSQAKFKRIAMEHYLHCMKVKIQSGELIRTNSHNS